MGIFYVRAEMVETESMKEQEIELEAQMLEAERYKERHIWRENALKADLAEAGGREKRDAIKG